LKLFSAVILKPLKYPCWLFSGPQFIISPIIWAAICRKLRKNGQKIDVPLNSETSLSCTRMFLGHSLDVPVLNRKVGYFPKYFTKFPRKKNNQTIKQFFTDSRWNI
jgi:hypothetical protein